MGTRGVGHTPASGNPGASPRTSCESDPNPLFLSSPSRETQGPKAEVSGGKGRKAKALGPTLLPPLARAAVSVFKPAVVESSSEQRYARPSPADTARSALPGRCHPLTTFLPEAPLCGHTWQCSGLSWMCSGITPGRDPGPCVTPGREPGSRVRTAGALPLKALSPLPPSAPFAPRRRPSSEPAASIRRAWRSHSSSARAPRPLWLSVQGRAAGGPEVASRMPSHQGAGAAHR